MQIGKGADNNCPLPSRTDYNIQQTSLSVTFVNTEENVIAGKMITLYERRFLMVTVCFAFLLLSRNENFVNAKQSSVPELSRSDRTRASLVLSPLSETRIPAIRGGSLEEGSSKSSDEDGDNNIEDNPENTSNSDSSSPDEIETEGSIAEAQTASDPDSSSKSSSSLSEIATALRLEGKKYHDQGDFEKAAEVFQKAADTLMDGDGDMKMSEDYATCRLHQALCNLKSENYELCIEACTDVLQDGSDESNSGSTHLPAITARAYHRRAKAKMALGDNAGALQDARTASFLGDGKAVNLYGKLMRETSSSDLTSLMNPLVSEPSSSISSPSPHSALLESLMKKSSDANSGGSSLGGFPGLNPASLLLGNGGGSNMLGALGSGSGGMAKSVVKNLAKRLDDESTQASICDFLQRTNKAQLQSFASMAGIGALQDSQLDKLVSFCHGVTPKGIRRTVRGTKILIYFGKVIRRTAQVMKKYRSLIVAALILQWTKSAILRPLPIDKRAAKKAAKLAAKEALKDAMKASRAGFF